MKRGGWEGLRVGVIGGGYAGMAAAVTLAEQGIPVTVFESAKQLGGRARGLQYNNTQLDNGQHILLGCYRNTLKLIEQVGGNIEQDFLRLPLQLTLHNRFELKAPQLPAPFHLLVALLTAQGLSFSQRLQAAKFMLAMRKIHFQLPLDMSALALLKINMQHIDLIELLWNPICISALNTPVEKASAQVLLNVLRDSLNGSFSDSEMLLPRLDFSALFPDRAAEYLKSCGGTVRTACGVEAIVPNNDGIELITAEGAQQFSHIICATSSANAARLFQPISELSLTTQQIDALTYQPIYTVYLQYPPHVKLPHPMLGFDRCFSQWLFDKGQIANQHGLIAVVISAEGLHQELDHVQLSQKVVAELCEQLGITELPLWQQVIAEKRATFSCEVNLNRPAHATSIDTILLAGDYTAGDYPATLEGAVMSGLRAANAITTSPSLVAN
ncbi:MAG: hydroxysqualene dehydroxylase HpnE [Gallionellaceae bacterium]|nr:hydroxysqualene dehydroxylase HpnE [Gallionellaceae bacterium]